MFGIRYLKASPTTHVIQFRQGAIVREGAGLAFFYYAPTSVIAQVPLASSDVPFVFNEVVLQRLDAVNFVSAGESALCVNRGRDCLVSALARFDNLSAPETDSIEVLKRNSPRVDSLVAAVARDAITVHLQLLLER